MPIYIIENNQCYTEYMAIEVHVNEGDNYSLLKESIEKDFQIEVSDIKKIENGFSNKVYFAKTPEEDVFIRMNRDTRIFPVEIVGYQEFARVGVPVPKVVGYEGNPIHLGYPTIILSRVPGEALNTIELTPEQERDIYSQAGKLLRNIHTIKVDGFGELVAEGGKLKGDAATWQQYWCNKRHERISTEVQYMLEHNFIDQAEADKLLAIGESIQGVEPSESVLLHKDFHGSHIFTDKKTITGIIDLGGIIGGDPRFDVAMSLFFQKPDQQKAFKEGYGKEAEDPVVEKYIALIAANKVVWRHQGGIIQGSQSALLKLKNYL